MHRLWAPWRRAYVEGAAGGSAPVCFLCDYAVEGREPELGIVWRWPSWYAVLNAYPYSNGHLMLALTRHHEGFIGLSTDEGIAFAPALARCEAVLRDVYAPHGLNIGVNVGRAAGAGAVGHLHVHLVPRWNGDTNFMSTIGETRVLPEGLADSYARLRAGFERTAP